MLVTGFEGYGGRAVNPAQEVARALDGTSIAGRRVRGRVLPVSYERLASGICALVAELRPRVVICLGLWPGEAVIRVERVAVNIAAFEIPDNEGLITKGPVDPEGPLARPSGLPVDRIVSGLIEAGIPARPSSTAGNFLCNALMYHAVGAAEAQDPPARAGFVHVPYLPLQVADLMRATAEEARLELHQRADLASMALETQVEAVRLACRIALEDAG